METDIVLQGVIIAHLIGMLVSAFWFWPIYIDKRNRKCMDVMVFIAVICWGFIPLVCLMIDLNKNS